MQTAQTAAQGALAVKLMTTGELLEQARLLQPFPLSGLRRACLAIWGWNFMLHPLLVLTQVTSTAVLEGTT